MGLAAGGADQHSSMRSSVKEDAEALGDDRPLEWQDDPLWFIRSKDRKQAAERDAQAAKRALREQKRKALQEIAQSQPYLQPALVPHQAPPSQSNIRTASYVSSADPGPRAHTTVSLSGAPEDGSLSHRVRIAGGLSRIPEEGPLSQRQLQQPQLSTVQRMQRHQQQQQQQLEQEQQEQQRLREQNDSLEQQQQQQDGADAALPQVPDMRKPTPPSGIPRVCLKSEPSMEELKPPGTLFASLPSGIKDSSRAVARLGTSADAGAARQRSASLPPGLPRAVPSQHPDTKSTSAGRGAAGGQSPMLSGSGAAVTDVGMQGEGYRTGDGSPQGLLRMRSMVRFSMGPQQRRAAGALAASQDALAPSLSYRTHSGSVSRNASSSSLIAPGSTGESEGGVEEGSGSGSETGSGSGSDEGDAEKAALKALRQQQLAYLAQHWRHNELVKHQTYFHVDLTAEEQKQRRGSQLAPEDPFGPINTSVAPSNSPRRSLSLLAAGQKEEPGIPMRPSSLFTAPLDFPGSRPRAKDASEHCSPGSGGGRMESGPLPAASQGSLAESGAGAFADADSHAGHKWPADGAFKASTQNGSGRKLLSPANANILGGLEGSSGHRRPAFKQEDMKGLAAEFRRALPLLCSQTAFMEGLQTAEEEELIAALRGEFDDAGAKKRRRRKGRRRGRRRKGEKDAKHPSSEGATSTGYTDPVFGGWNKVPPLDYTNTAVNGKGKGGLLSEKRSKGGKRSKRGSKGGKASSLKALRAVDMAAYLAKACLQSGMKFSRVVKLLVNSLDVKGMACSLCCISLREEWRVPSIVAKDEASCSGLKPGEGRLRLLSEKYEV
ncbi:hypothetical protein DUNSADRAFT_8108 [Dunaliella salina]|uniref:Uncharacterized protein n=1 Tax=Dunaliella salina TaxID=3046 RepID=A0ABQ7GK09_DUNSA|nr:hypothetical protein DUNSADRAFT_8108 [Dunaliella salina]|eukprot:KAF5834959.1 hypothetical protein DUNSADRAFT_8108 [Dunaliella salina]